MPDYALPVVKEVIAALKASAAVTALVGTRIYTDVPQKADFPYIVVGISGEPFATDDYSGQRHTVRVQAFSRKAKIEECLSIRAAVFTALDRQEDALSLSAGDIVECIHDGVSDAFIEDDGKTWQSIIEFSATTQ